MSGLADCIVSIAGEVAGWGALNLLKVADLVASRRNLSLERVNTIVGDDSLQKIVAHSVAKYAEEETGLVLDPDTPFSDASLGNAIQARTVADLASAALSNVGDSSKGVLNGGTPDIELSSGLPL